MLDLLVPKITTAGIMGVPALAYAAVAEAGGTFPEWMGNLTNITAFGLVAWIVQHTLTKVIPDMQTAHARDLTLQRESYDKQLKEQRDAHGEQTKEQRDANVQAMSLVANAHARAAEVMTTAFSSALKDQRSDLLARIPGSVVSPAPHQP